MRVLRVLRERQRARGLYEGSAGWHLCGKKTDGGCM